MSVTESKQWGGRRKGAGKPKGKGRFRGLPTKMYRLPVELEDDIRRLVSEKYPDLEICFDHLENCFEDSARKAGKNG